MAASHSLSSSHSSSLLESMCAGIIDSPLEDEVFHHTDGEKLHHQQSTSSTSHGDESLARSLVDLLPNNITLEEGGTSVLNHVDGNLTPRTLKSILRTSHPSPSSNKHVTICSPSPGNSNTTANQQKAGKKHSFLVCTKDYDGEARPSAFTEVRRDSSSSTGVDEHGTEEDTIDQVLQSTLGVDAHGRVTKMEWKETIAPHRLGVYSGVIDKKSRPHGRGIWEEVIPSSTNTYSKSSSPARLCGWWYKGNPIPYEYIAQKYNRSKKQVKKRETVDKPKKESDRDASDIAFISMRAIPPPPFADDEPIKPSCSLGRRRKEGINAKSRNLRSIEKQNYQDLSHHQYKLGEMLRSQDDVVNRRAGEGQLHVTLVSELRPNDHAFVRRSDGSFTYATVTHRLFDLKSNEEVVVFEVNSSGSTKIIPRSKWKHIRILREHQQLQPHEISPTCVKEKAARSLMQCHDRLRSLARSSTSSNESVSE